MKYIKLFDNHTKYEEFLESEEFITPYAVWCKLEDEGHVHKFIETRLVAKFNITNTSLPTQIGYAMSQQVFASIEVDGVKISVEPNESNYITYDFETEGEHTVKYEFIDKTKIYAGTLKDCSSLTSVTLPEGITEIGNNAFENCTGLTSLVIPEGVEDIGVSSFKGCTGLTSVVIPDGVTTIGMYAFNGCTGLTSIVIPDGVVAITNNAFENCTGLTSFVIPESAVAIGISSFNGCTGLTSIVIPDGITAIGNNAFNGCTGLESITCQSSTPATIGTGVFDNTNDCPIYVPENTGNTYKTTNGWSTYASRIVEQVPNYVDLGLPSGTLWGRYNLGAESETDGGLYYQWGDVQGYSASQVGTGIGLKAFTTSDYKYYSIGDVYTKYNSTDNKTSLDLSDDAANYELGDNWRMPHNMAIAELVENTTKQTFTKDGVDGVLLTSNINNKTLFFPFVQLAEQGEVADETFACFWSSEIGSDFGSVNESSASSLMFYLQTGNLDVLTPAVMRSCGCTIRPVIYDETYNWK